MTVLYTYRITSYNSYNQSEITIYYIES